MLIAARRPASVRKNAGRAIHAADRTDAGGPGRGDGHAPEACERTVHGPAIRDRGDCPDPGAGIREQPLFLAEHAAAGRAVAGHACAGGTGSDRAPSADWCERCSAHIPHTPERFHSQAKFVRHELWSAPSTRSGIQECCCTHFLECQTRASQNFEGRDETWFLRYYYIPQIHVLSPLFHSQWPQEYF